jgi:hypothetical protein
MNTSKTGAFTVEDQDRAGTRRREAAAGGGPSLSYEYVQLNYQEGIEELGAVLDSAQKWFQYLEPQAREDAFKLLYNAFWFIREHGFSNVSFLTLTIKENVVDAREAQRRANSFQSNILQKRYGHRYLRVFERQTRGAVHYHYLAALPQDIRTGFDWEAQGEIRRLEKDGQRGSPEWRRASRRRDLSAGPYLRGEWAFFRKLFGQHKNGQHTPGRYGFDRHELLPLRTRIGSVVEYLGKYIGKDFDQRQEADRGVRRVSYGRGVAKAAGRMTILCPGNDNCRDKQKFLASLFGFGPADYDRGFKRMLGPRWGYHLLKAAKGLQLPLYRTGTHAFLDGVITRFDIEELGFPTPLNNAVEVSIHSPGPNDQWTTAYAKICQARYHHNHTAPWPEGMPMGGQPQATPQSLAPEPAAASQPPATKKPWIELSLKED